MSFVSHGKYNEAKQSSVRSLPQRASKYNYVKQCGYGPARRPRRGGGVGVAAVPSLEIAVREMLRGPAHVASGFVRSLTNERIGFVLRAESSRDAGRTGSSGKTASA